MREGGKKRGAGDGGGARTSKMPFAISSDTTTALAKLAVWSSASCVRWLMTGRELNVSVARCDRKKWRKASAGFCAGTGAAGGGGAA